MMGFLGESAALFSEPLPGAAESSSDAGFGTLCLRSSRSRSWPRPGRLCFTSSGRAVEEGRRAGFVSMLGVGAGEVVSLLRAAVGLSALLAHSTVALGGLRYLGAACLVLLGVLTWQRSVRSQFGFWVRRCVWTHRCAGHADAWTMCCQTCKTLGSRSRRDCCRKCCGYEARGRRLSGVIEEARAGGRRNGIHPRCPRRRARRPRPGDQLALARKWC
jgi:LysE type translocator